MENLFSEDPQFRRVQYKKLSDNVREWQQEISALIAEKLPKDLGLDVAVVFQDVDDEKGYAVGTAIAKDGSSSKSIGIPIVVKAWHLAPIDLFFSESKLYPLTDDNVAKVFYQSSLGAGVASKKPPPNMADDVFAGGMALKRGFALESGCRVLVVEDITTTGGSVKKSIVHLRNRGAEVVGVSVLIDRSAGEAAFDCRFEPLATLDMQSWPPEDCPLCDEGITLIEPDHLVA